MADDRLHILEPDPNASGPGTPSWLAGAVAEFREQVGHRGYPCVFGHQALTDRELWYTWVRATEPAPLVPALATFLDRTLAMEGRQSLAVFVEPMPAEVAHAEYDEIFWALLRHLYEHDDRDWPVDEPTDPEQEGWQFHFHNTPFFVFGLAPTHVLRRSRNAGRSLVLMFLPKYVFDDIEVGTVTGNAARVGIRRRLAQWDAVPIHPSLGTIELMSQHEWNQYFVPEDEHDLHESCPLSAVSDHRTSARTT